MPGVRAGTARSRQPTGVAAPRNEEDEQHRHDGHHDDDPGQPAAEQAQQTAPNATSPARVHDQHGLAVRVPDLQEPVVQVLLVRAERRPAGAGAADHGEHQVGRTARSGSRPAGGAAAGQRASGAALPALRDVVAGNCPVRLIEEQESTNPSSIEPESPMNIRAGKKLCGRTPMQAPAERGHSSAAGWRATRRSRRRARRRGEERDRADRHHAGGQAVEAVDEVHRVPVPTMSSTVKIADCALVEPEPPPGSGR